MTGQRSALLIVSLACWLAPALAPSSASAQTTVQGQIIIQEAQPSTTTAAPPPQAQAYGVPVAQDVYVQPQMPAQPQCPMGSAMGVDSRGRPGCVVEVTRHRVIGGLLGGGIGLLVGGWVISGVFGTIATVGGAVGCALASGCSWTTSGYSSAFLDWGWVPILGPWVQMGYLWENADGGMYAWLAVEALLQAGGLTMLIFGALGEDVTQFEPAQGYVLNFRPIVSPTVQGVSAQLTF